MAEWVPIIKHGIWALTLLITIALLRKPLGNLIGKSKQVKYKDLEITFEQDIRQIEDGIRQENLPRVDESATHKDVDLLELASIAPKAAVQEAWQQIEQRSHALLQERKLSIPADSPTPHKAIELLLIEHDLLNDNKARVFRELRQLRNKAVHADNYRVSSKQAAEYVKLSFRLDAYLKSLQAPA